MTKVNFSSISLPIGEERMEPLIWILDTSYQYGNEFYGMDAGVALTPITEKCFLTMSQALQRYQGSAVTGPVGCGKTETVKVIIIDIRNVIVVLVQSLLWPSLSLLSTILSLLSSLSSVFDID